MTPELEIKRRTILRGDLDAILQRHRIWLATRGQEGCQADLGAVDLEGEDLAGAVLDAADLHETSFRGANLLGASLRKANLRNADLRDVRGLTAGQLAAADLSGAQLPEEISRFDGLLHVEHMSKSSGKLFLVAVLGCVYAGLTVLTTTDARLIVDTVSTPLPIIGTKIPIAAFYLVSPFILLAAYIYLHLQLQRLWQGLAELPGVFPDGVPLDERVFPWLLNGFAAARLAPLRKVPLLPTLERLISVLLAWWLVPFLLAAIWLRHLPRHDWDRTVVHVAILGVVVFFAIWFRRLASSTMARQPRRTSLNVALFGGLFTALIALAISYGAIRGSDDDTDTMATIQGQRGEFNLLRWLRRTTPRLLGELPFGVHAFAQLDEEKLSSTNEESDKNDQANGLVATGEAESTPQADDEHPVQAGRPIAGARLNGMDLRGASAKGVFLKAASLRGTDFRGANLVAAQLDRADMQGALLDRAYLFEARLRQADLTGAYVQGAYLADAAFDKAKLRFAHFAGAMLAGASLNDADLLGTDLKGAVLSGASLRNAKVLGAQLDNTVLYDVDLRSVNGLEQAQLEKACVGGKTKLPPGLRLPVSNPCAEPVDVVVPKTCDRPPPCEIRLQSDASTLAAAVGGAGEPDDGVLRALQSEPPAVEDLEFKKVRLGGFFSATPLPEGAPPGTQVVNIPPGDGRSGYFKMVFVAPAAYSGVELVGRANIDDLGQVFLNGHHLSSPLFCTTCGARLSQYQSSSFRTTEAQWFKPGTTNVLLISDANVGGGPSAGAFYIAIKFAQP